MSYASAEASWLEPDETPECRTCYGEATMECEECDGEGCPECDGVGTVTCRRCQGSGADPVDYYDEL